MREFRGKRTKDKEWVEGYYIKFYGNGEREPSYMIFTLDEENKTSQPYYIDPETVCRYTGLTDKNGRKVFEGDIVRDIFNTSVVGIVRYGEYRNTFNDDEHGGHVGFYIEWKEKKDLLRKDLVYWTKNSEFIGNIFDNPELLKN